MQTIRNLNLLLRVFHSGFMIAGINRVLSHKLEPQRLCEPHIVAFAKLDGPARPAIGAVLLSAVPIAAQDFRGRINGTVSDISGAVVPGVSIEIADTRDTTRPPFVCSMTRCNASSKDT